MNFQKSNRFLSKYICNRKSFSSGQWTSTVGLEIHAQITAKSKLFSAGGTGFALAVNDSVNLLDAAIPGTLPVLNKECVKAAVKAASAFSCKISPVSLFDRKHYFYADLPSGYQITQQRVPIASNGLIEFFVYNPGVHKVPYRKSCRLKQIQLEQDSGKSMHDTVNRTSLVDLNRAGVGLLEFVFEPDLKDGEEAAALAKELSLILESLEVCSCKMQEGALRIDANVSVSDNPDKLGTRTEIKNIGSIRGVANAVKYEIDRHLKLVTTGNDVTYATRGWDPQNKKTVVMRQKEEVHDYRFMPEPNLPPLRLFLNEKDRCHPQALDVRDILAAAREMPEDSRKYLIEKYEFSDIYALILVNHSVLHNHFKEIIASKPERPAKLVWKLLMVQLLNVINNNELSADIEVISSECLGEIVDLLAEEKIDFETCRDIMDLKIKGSPLTAWDIVAENSWQLVSDKQIIEELCLKAIENNPKAVKKFKKGKPKALQPVVEYVRSLHSGRLNLSLVSKRLKEMIESS